MVSNRFGLPQRKIYDMAYEQAAGMAAEQLAQMDIEEQCRRSGTEYRSTDSRKEVLLRYLNQQHTISLPEAKVTLAGTAVEVPIRDKILILHYLITAKGTPATGKLITFRELPEGKVYQPTFEARTSRPLVSFFGSQPELLLKAVGPLGGRKSDLGDTSVVIEAFSRISISIVLWRGDDEFPPASKVLFDANISDYLPTEDITVLCETITWKMVKSVRGQ